MSVHSNDAFTLRVATADDLDDLTDIACGPSPIDPQWSYRFPRRNEFPEDHWNCTRLSYKTLLETPGTTINIMTTPTTKDGATVQRSIALAVWERPKDAISNMSITGPAGGEGRRDANFAHMKAFKQTLATAQKRWFDNVYGDKRLHLKILRTHPDYQKRGAGTQHCRWGMELARADGIPVTLFASPMGKRLYSHLGFLLLDTVTVQVEGEEEKLSIGVMVYKL